MDAVRSGIGKIDEEAGRQLALDVEVVLLHVSVLGIGVGRQCRRTVCRDESREVGLRTASGWQKDALRAEWTRIVRAGESCKSGSSESAIRAVQGTEGGCV